MKKSENAFSILKEKQIMALLNPKSVEQCVTAYEIFSSVGVPLEITFRSEASMEGIRTVLKKYPDAVILAGTVMTKKQAEMAIQAGVSGIVSADYIPAVVQVCVKNDIMCAPGGLGDVGKQLVQKAELYDCEFEELKIKYPYQWIYKLFPAVTATQSNIGLSKAWKGPFKGLVIFYTGGVSLKNLADMIRSDPDGIFCGSALTKSIDNPDQMKEEAEQWLSVIKDSRKGF